MTELFEFHLITTKINENKPVSDSAYTWKYEFEQGKKYFATVEACNRAGLCRVTSSNSITFDNSPPTAGYISVGPSGHHSKYLGHRLVETDNRRFT